MKKIFTCSIACVLSVIFTVSAYATSISVKDSASDVVCVTGDAPVHNQPVTLVVLNPGYDIGNLTSNDYEAQTDAIQYFNMEYPIDGKYSFDVPMHNAGGIEGGDYQFIVTVGDEKVYDDDYSFYFNDVKLGIINTVNTQSPITNVTLTDAYTKFSLNKFELYQNGNKANILSALSQLKQNRNGVPFENDVNKFDLTLRCAALLSAFNTSNSNLLVKDGILMYSDLLGIEDQQYWKDYIDCVKPDGKTKLNADLIGKSYASIEEISSSLRELVAYYGLINYKVNGFGHMDTFFVNYADVYAKYGFETYKLTSDNKNLIYSKLADTNTTNLADLAIAFNSLFEENGGGGGSTGGSSNGGSSYYPSAGGNAYITPEIGFDDIESAEWAKDAIMTLAEKGIINGKANRVFAPNDYVTRAEFLKMLISALEITGSNAECGFLDVSNHWGKSYIANAFENGIAKGVTESLFEPDGVITREMGAVFSDRALNNKGISLEKDSMIFADDTAISEYAKESVYNLKLAGIIGGVGDNIFNPNGIMTRAQAAKMIYEVMIYSEGELKDE